MGTPELVTSFCLEFTQAVGAVVGQGMPLEPGPQIFNRVEVGCVGWQKFNFDLPAQPSHILVHLFAMVRSQTIPDHQQRTFDLELERLQEFDHLLLPDAALIQAEIKVVARERGDDRDVRPIEVKVDDGRVSLGCPGAHARGALAQARLVYEDDFAPLAPGFFLRAGQVRRRQAPTAFWSRSIARRSGFCGLKPKAPRISQILVRPNLTP